LEEPTSEEVMIKFISSIPSLKLIINLLSDVNKGIQLEAFMLLGILISNISKATNPDIKALLLKNKLSLLGFVKELTIEAEEEYKVNKEVLLHQLDTLV
jgi:hypothetical protein